MKRLALTAMLLLGLSFPIAYAQEASTTPDPADAAAAAADAAEAAKMSAAWDTVVQRTVFLSISPENPRSHDVVTLTATSYNTDINRANITWRVNGKVLKKGIGEKVFTVIIGGAGEKTEITAEIATFEGLVITKSQTFIPQEVDIVWQANSYVPPFYKGKALLPLEGDMTVTAIPNFITETGEVIPANKLLYTWSKDGDVQGDLSGYGRNKVSLTQSVITRSTEVKVRVTNLDKTMTAEKTITIVPQDSMLLLYENNPLYGILFNKAFAKSAEMTSDELSILAVPLFLSVPKRDDIRLTYEWAMNNTVIPNQANPSLITVRKPAGVSGASLINASIENTTKIFQRVENVLTLTYNKTQNETF